MIEHCISALKFSNERKQYRAYITDALMAIAENTTHIQGHDGVVEYGKTITKRWLEMLEPPKEDDTPEDNRPSEEIARDMWERIRGH